MQDRPALVGKQRMSFSSLTMSSWVVFAFLLSALAALLPLARYFYKRRRQRVFIQQRLASSDTRHQPHVIISLSTLPDRIERLGPALRCLLKQTRAPDEILLALPEFSRRQNRGYNVPKYLAQFSRLRILHCETDWGPATKFIPAIQAELAAGRTETLMMVVDDDRIYPRDALETYLHYNAQLPNAALCFRGGPMPRSLDWRDSKLFFANKIREPRRVAVMTGCGSYLVRPRFFDSSLWDYSAAPRGAFYMDDMWISGCLDRRGVEKYVIPASAMMRSVFRQFGTMNLHDVPNGRRQNNNETIAFFRTSWNVFASC
jgi:hypothetical protein